LTTSQDKDGQPMSSLGSHHSTPRLDESTPQLDESTPRMDDPTSGQYHTTPGLGLSTPQQPHSSSSPFAKVLNLLLDHNTLSAVLKWPFVCSAFK